MGRANINHASDTLTDPQIPTLSAKLPRQPFFHPLLHSTPASLRYCFTFLSLHLAWGGSILLAVLWPVSAQGCRGCSISEASTNSRKYLAILTLYSSFLLPLKEEEEEENLHTHNKETYSHKNISAQLKTNTIFTHQLGGLQILNP